MRFHPLFRRLTLKKAALAAVAVSVAFAFTAPKVQAQTAQSVLQQVLLKVPGVKATATINTATAAQLETAVANAILSGTTGYTPAALAEAALEPYPISQVTVTAAAILLCFDVSGNTLLAAGNTTGQRNPGTPDFDFTGDLTLTIMDLTNVQAPAVVTTFTTSLQVNGTFHVAGFYGDSIFAIVNNPPDTDDFGPSSLMIVDASTPSAIVVYPFQTQFGFSGILTTNNGYLLAATSLGLNIYKLQL